MHISPFTQRRVITFIYPSNFVSVHPLQLQIIHHFVVTAPLAAA